jgi:hypothetical protein
MNKKYSVKLVLVFTYYDGFILKYSEISKRICYNNLLAGDHTIKFTNVETVKQPREIYYNRNLLVDLLDAL